MYFYSASQRGFFVDTIHGDGMPSDVVQISDELYHSLLAANAEGKSIIPDAEGRPMAVRPAGPTEANARAFRNAELRRTDGLVLRHREEIELQRQPTLSLGEFARLLLYRQALRDWPESLGFPTAGVPQWEKTK